MLPELNVDTVNKIMNEFLENKNKLGKLHNDLENNYGKEYFLTKLSAYSFPCSSAIMS